MEQINQWLPIIAFIGTVILGITVWYGQWRSGTSEVSKDIIDTYKLRVEQLEANEKVAQERSFNNTKEIGQLQGALAEKEKEIARLREILENRNPELVQVLTQIKDFMLKINDHMDEHTKLMKENITPAPQFIK